MAGEDDAALPPEKRRRIGDVSAVGSLIAIAEEARTRILGFLAGASASAAAACRRLSASSRSPAAWEGVRIELSAVALGRDELREAVVRMASAAWGLADEVVLQPHPMRRQVERELSRAHPRLRVSVGTGADIMGPLPLFTMGVGLFPIGTSTALHFFEPRYRWMCERIINEHRPPHAPPAFAFVTSGHPVPGGRGHLCWLRDYEANPNGTFDTIVTSKAEFTLLEVWTEPVPGRPSVMPLGVGYVRVRAGEDLSVAGLPVPADASLDSDEDSPDLAGEGPCADSDAEDDSES